MCKYTTVLTNDHDGDLSQNSANSKWNNLSLLGGTGDAGGAGGDDAAAGGGDGGAAAAGGGLLVLRT